MSQQDVWSTKWEFSIFETFHFLFLVFHNKTEQLTNREVCTEVQFILMDYTDAKLTIRLSGVVCFLHTQYVYFLTLQKHKVTA